MWHRAFEFDFDFAILKFTFAGENIEMLILKLCGNFRGRVEVFFRLNFETWRMWKWRNAEQFGNSSKWQKWVDAFVHINLMLQFIGKRTPLCKAGTCGHSLCTFNVWLNEILIDLHHVELTGRSCVEFPKLRSKRAIRVYFWSITHAAKIDVNRMAYPQNSFQ